MTNSRSEARAREVLYQQLEAAHFENRANILRDGGDIDIPAEVAVAAILAAFTEPAAAMPGVPEREAIIEIIRGQMREWWDEICSDTGCHPLDIVQEGRRVLSYHDRHWTDFVSRFSADAILALIPSHSGETGEVERRRALAKANNDLARRYAEQIQSLRGAAVLALELIECIQDEEGFSPSVAIPAQALRKALATPNDGGRDDAPIAQPAEEEA